MLEKMVTQISGKYSKEELRLFDFKKSLEQANIHVNYPAGEEVLEDKKGFAITHESESEKPFEKTEADFLRSIKETPVHIVFNIYKNKEGYIGESASIEIAYALVHNKPIVLLRNPIFAESVPNEIKYIISEKVDKLSIASLDSLAPEEIKKFINSRSNETVNYKLTEKQKITCMHYIKELLKSKRFDWKSKKEGDI